MTRKHLLSFVLAALMALLLVPSLAFAADATLEVGTKDELTAAFDTANSNTDTHYTIALTEDIDMASSGLSLNGAQVTLEGNGHTLRQVGTIHVNAGATLDLGSENGTALTIGGIHNNDEPGIVNVGKDGVLNMYDGVTLKDHKGENYFGGGVTVASGTFNMLGGTIENCGIATGSTCYGGGVAVLSDGTFNMSGGTIKDCYVSSTSTDNYYTQMGYSPQLFPNTAGGGVFVGYHSTFNFTGGKIQNCSSAYYGGGVMVLDSPDGQMGYLNSRFTMSDEATIEDCTAAFCGGGLGVLGYPCAASPIGYTQNINSTMANRGIYISGGTIQGNDADGYGGGVFLRQVRSSIPVELKNAAIQKNIASVGGGVSIVAYWTQATIDGCTITDNIAIGNGGGVALLSNSSSSGTTLTNSTLTGNKSGDAGAGVFYDDRSTLKIAGALKIQDNLRFDGEFGPYTDDTYTTLQDDAAGTLNNLNILSLGKPVTVVDSLDGAQVGVTDPALADGETTSTARLTSGFKATNDSLLPYSAFTSDHDNWYPYFGEGEYENEMRLVQSTYVLHYNDADTEDHTKVVNYNPAQILDLETPTNGNKVFGGWYDNADLNGTPVSTTPATYSAEPIHYYAKWIDLHSVTYLLNDGVFDTVPEEWTPADDGSYTQSVADGDTLTAPADPGRKGYTFKGWFAVDAAGNLSDTAFDFSTPIADDLTLQAQWSKNTTGGGGGGGFVMTHTLHYDSNGGTTFADERYSNGTLVKLTKVPVRTGYTFTGWYADKNLTKAIDTITITASATVYAGWEVTEVPSDLNGDDHFAYVVGYEDGTVRPTNNITRAETATIFFRLLKDEVRDGNLTAENNFTDVEDGFWYNKPVSTLAALDVIKGVTPTRFNPDASITRAEFAAICARFDHSSVVLGDDHFSDTDGHWAAAEIERAVSLGWISGYEDGTFRPNQPITRAEAMSIINRVLNRLPENADDLLSGMNTWSDNRASAWYYLAVQEATNSHEFERKTNGVNETWVELKADPDWSRYM